MWLFLKLHSHSVPGIVQFGTLHPACSSLWDATAHGNEGDSFRLSVWNCRYIFATHHGHVEIVE